MKKEKESGQYQILDKGGPTYQVIDTWHNGDVVSTHKKTGSTLVKTVVAVVETDVFGVKGYNIRCFNCGKESKRYNKENTAVRLAKKHICRQKKRRLL